MDGNRTESTAADLQKRSESFRSRFRPNLVYLLVTLGFLCFFIAFKGPPLVTDVAYFLGTPERNAKVLLTGSTRLALLSQDRQDLSSHIKEVSRLPYIRGVIVTSNDNRIISGAWLGEELAEIDALKKMVQESWKQWPVTEGTETVAHVFVTFDEVLNGQVMADLILVVTVLAVGIFILAILISLDARSRLAQRISALSGATTRIANGDYSVRVPVPGRDAISALAHNFNRMAGELDKATKQLRISEERFELAVNGSNDAIWDWNIQNNRLYLSPRYRRILGYEAQELPGIFTAWEKLIHPDDKPFVLKALDEHIQKGKPFRCELRLKTKRGEWLWMLGRGEAVRDKKTGVATRMAGSYTDISEQKATQLALEQEKERAQVTLRSITDAVVTTDNQGNIDYLNPRAELLLGIPDLSAEGQPLLEVFKLTDAQRNPIDDDIITSVLLQGKTVKFSDYTLLRNAAGEWLSIEENAAPLLDQDQAVRGMVVVFHDVTERMKLWEELQKERERAMVTLQSIGDGVVTTDISGKIVYMNPTAEALTGWSSNSAQERPIEEVINFLDEFGASSIAKSVEVALTKKQVAADLGQAELLSISGEKHIVEHNIAPLRDKNKNVIGGVVIMHNVTDRYKLMQQLSHQATHDSLTQLVNRTGFEQRLGKILRAISTEENVNPVQHVICYMDLDQFKIVNDTCGHSAGDELLRQIAEQLQRHVRIGDMLARLGGDEFGLLLENCPLENALGIAEKIRQHIASFRFSSDGKTFAIGVSIGVAPIDGTPGTTVATVLSTVDQACYIAKSKGRNRIHTFQPGDNESSRWHTEMQWVPHINQALDDGHFILFAQPIATIGRNEAKHSHYEILLRMKSEDGNLIAPGSFLPSAERYGLMPTLDRWVVGKAIEMLAFAWKNNPNFNVDTFGINISGAVLGDNTLLKYVKQALNGYDLPPSLLCFEITETVAIANFTHATRFVNELKEMGCRFALDDFGSGFASFSYLKTLPVDYLKIDGTFVRHLSQSAVDHTMVDAINQLGHVMGLKTIAEFVETQDILESLRILDVDYAQGYYIGKPIPLHDVCYATSTESNHSSAPELIKTPSALSI
ncbi:MAG: EAL domain-containing protein [Gammaproteobacteria bacterium]|nr:EAL domain-containing protein [Gammaproteobacteria bacterium]